MVSSEWQDADTKSEVNRVADVTLVTGSVSRLTSLPYLGPGPNPFPMAGLVGPDMRRNG